MLVTDGNGIPIGFLLDSAQVHEVRLAPETLNTLKIRNKTRPKKLVADRGYDSRRFRAYLRARGIAYCIPPKRRPKNWKPRRGRPPSYNPHTYKSRWIIERTFAWLGNYRRLLIRWERHLCVYRGFFLLALISIAINRLLI